MKLNVIEQLELQINDATLMYWLATPLSSQLPPGIPRRFKHLTDGELGPVKDYVHRVKRWQDIMLRSTKLHRLPPALPQQVASELHQLENKDFIVDNNNQQKQSTLPH
ncbi:hypothetical protein MRX96_015201 [Rhipicephalus microplus]